MLTAEDGRKSNGNQFALQLIRENDGSCPRYFFPPFYLYFAPSFPRLCEFSRAIPRTKNSCSRDVDTLPPWKWLPLHPRDHSRPVAEIETLQRLKFPIFPRYRERCREEFDASFGFIAVSSGFKRILRDRILELCTVVEWKYSGQ